MDNLEKENRYISDEFSKTKQDLNKTLQLSDEANKRLAMKSKDMHELENANVSFIVLLYMIISVSKIFLRPAVL